MDGLTGYMMRWVKDWKGLYSVSREGRVYSHPRVTPHGHRRKGRFLANRYSSDGSPYVWLWSGDIRKQYRISRLVAEAFVPKPDDPEATEVCHLDLNPSNNAAENLAWLSRSERQKLYEAYGFTRGVGKKWDV